MEDRPADRQQQRFLTPDADFTPLAATLGESPRVLDIELEFSVARVSLIGYPASTDFDTHRHDEAYLCLLTHGAYAEWVGATRRRLVASEQVVYHEGSRHAVRTGPAGARVLHVSDSSGHDWRVGPSWLSAGLLRQIAATLTFDEIGDDVTRLHLESLVEELRPTKGDGRRMEWLEATRRRLREGYATPIRLERLAWPLACTVHISPERFAWNSA